jgi:hypothetical protein
MSPIANVVLVIPPTANVVLVIPPTANGVVAIFLIVNGTNELSYYCMYDNGWYLTKVEFGSLDKGEPFSEKITVVGN